MRRPSDVETSTGGHESTNGSEPTTAGSTRRRVLAAGGALATAGLAGCTALDVFTGDEPAEFTAGTATVDDETLADSGYELNEVRSASVSQEFEAAGSTREVQVTNQTAEYDKAVELFGERYQAAVVAVLTTPRVEVLGTTFNPIGDLDDEERAELIVERYDEVDELERGSEYAIEVLDTEVDVVVYTAEGQIEGTGVTVDLEVHVGDAIEAGDDFVIPLAAYPEALGDGENVRRMFGGITHQPPE